MAVLLEWSPPGSISAAFARSDAFSRRLIGPMLGGRKTTAVADIVRRPGRLAAGGRYQREWRWLVAAPTEAKLERVKAAWHARVPAETGRWDEGAGIHAVQYQVARYASGIAVAVLEVRFFALDSVAGRRRFGTVPATGVWLEDGRSMEEEVYEAAVDVAGMWPASATEDALWGGVVVTSRMPALGHWLQRRTDIQEFRQAGGRSPQAEVAHLPPGFYERQALRGKGESWIACNVDGEFPRFGGVRPTLLQVIEESYGL
jgi:hypothetical protein